MGYEQIEGLFVILDNYNGTIKSLSTEVDLSQDLSLPIMYS